MKSINIFVYQPAIKEEFPVKKWKGIVPSHFYLEEKILLI